MIAFRPLGRHRARLLAFVCPLACGGSGGADPDDSSSSSSSSAEAVEDSTTNPGNASSSSSSGPVDPTGPIDTQGADSTTGVEPSVCGNGIVEEGEACDSGSSNGHYGACAIDCSGPGPHCGDGEVTDEEICDDGNAVNGDGCNCVPSGTVLWDYVGPEWTSFQGVAVAPDGTAMAGGNTGNPFQFGPFSARYRLFDVDGSLLAEDDAIVTGESAIWGVSIDDEARWWLLGERNPVSWIYRIEDGVGDQLTYTLSDVSKAVVAPDGTVVSGVNTFGFLDADDQLAWSVELGWIDDIALTADGTILVLAGDGYGEPRSVRPYTLDGTPTGTPVDIADMTYNSNVLAIDGGFVIAGFDDTDVTPEQMPFVAYVRAYDDAGTVLWEHVAAPAQRAAIETDGSTIVVAGDEYTDTQHPSLLRLDMDGNELSSIVLDPLDYGMGAGFFTDVAIAPDGSLVATGDLFDTNADPFEPPVHAFAVKIVP